MENIFKKNLRKLCRRKEKMFPGSSLCRSFPFLKPCKKSLEDWLTSDPIEVLGHRMYVDLPDSLGLRRKAFYGSEETALLEQIVKPGDSVLDIGANIGYFTLLLNRWTGPQGRVLAFEPDPVNFSILRKNLEANGYRHDEAFQKAVSNKNGILRLYVCEFNRGDHRAYDNGDSRQSVEIEAVALDDFLGPAYPDIAFIKMDIQGSESLAVEGMQRLLAAQKNLVLFLEFWPEALAKSGRSAAALLQQLEELGFSFENLPDGASVPIPVTPGQLLSEYNAANGHSTNLFCRKLS